MVRNKDSMSAMSYSDMPIRPLPPEVAAKLHSSVRITHLNQVALELVKNALDADAQSIAIIVDFRRGGLVVQDDGYGIPPTEFEAGSGLAQAHNTSKAGRESAYGCKGLFLAALATMSLLTITSRHRGQPRANTIAFHHSEVISRLVPAPSHQAISESQGTKVTVNNLFGNMPVRLKYRASTLQRPEDIDKEWDELKRMLVAIILPNDRLQKLRISDSEKTRIMNIRLPPASDEISTLNTTRLQMIFVQSGLITAPRTGQWVNMSANTPELSIEAYVSLSPSPTKLIQFISIGNEPLFTAHSSANILYNKVNQVFAASDFGSSASPNYHANELSELESNDASLKSASRAGTRWPMFYIRIGASASWKIPEHDEKAIESDRTLQHIVNVLDAMFCQFLQQHHYRPRKKQRTQQTRQPPIEGPTSPSTTTQATKESRSFSSWSRVKSADSQAYSDLFGNQPRTTSASVVKPPHGTLQTGNGHNESDFHTSSNQTADNAIAWTEPGTNQTVLVNSRTGQCLPKTQQSGRPRSADFTSNRLQNIAIRPKSAPARDRSVWLDSIIRDWVNPVFPRPETPILSAGCVPHDEHQAANHFLRDVSNEKNVGRGSNKLSKSSLAKAYVVGQVDHKFILIRVPVDNKPGTEAHSQKALVLVDQHAADERCRLEQLFSEMFTIDKSQDGAMQKSSIRTYEFTTPLRVDVEEQETHVFSAYSRFFASWGCHYQIVKTPTERPSLLVDTLPIGIAERCRLEPTLLADLLRKETWRRAGERIPPVRSSQTTASTNHSSSSSFPWLDLIAGCPETIIDLLNSRACRSSIMFNDSLSRDECQSLVMRLARCAFPFQCAHGRPSMVPIADALLTSFPTTTTAATTAAASTTPQEEPSFVDAFKKWTAGSSV
ncbi:DNA mismatch repair protein MLH3 [Talaromyces islandicus]|uniref:DNA mismatch repair protein MLH3 n=1 Tax=Talaromyces islandicus TaxID=28573 RepID=A0A0U1LQ68_TALIS|nr:DNA mismatch repair protein MLH3 [Talaromyces islandicus]